MTKIVDVTCPRCGAQARLATGEFDVDSGELVSMPCPQCGLILDFES